MKSFCGVAVVLAAAAFQFGIATDEGFTSKVTPIQKVIQLMEGMLHKGKMEKRAEQVQFAAYRQFCADTSHEKTRAIEEAVEKMESLKAHIEKSTAVAAKLKKELAALDEDVAVWTGDEKAATSVHRIEEADHHAMHKDLTESIDALGRAIKVLKKRNHDVKQAEDDEEHVEDFLQLSALKHVKLIPEETKHVVDAFLQAATAYTGEDMEALTGRQQAPEANAYEFQSSGVIEMLEKLLDKFVAELTALEKEQANSNNAYQLLMQDLGSQIEQAEKDINAKTEHRTSTLQSKAKAVGNLQDTSKTEAADKKYLADLTATCEQKTTDFESRQQLRGEEIEAIEKALEIISSGAVAGNADKRAAVGLVQLSSPATLAQLRTNMQSQVRMHVLQYLKGRAKQLDSRLLSGLAARVTNDPLTKVKKMIKDLIVRLMEEANEEAEHKGWCDTELGTNAQTRNEKSEEVETLHADIEELEASSAKLADEITDLSRAVAELDGAMAKATQLRQEEKAANFATIQDAMEAQEAVEQAIRVLKEFYEKAGDATAFVQKQKRAEPEPPEVFDSAYKGMGAESGGVVGMLEVIETDFARLESETKAAEANGQKEYDSFMSDSKVDKAEKKSMMEHKEEKAEDQHKMIVTKHKDLVGSEKELDAALQYFDKLKPSCVDSGVSYEDRVARRKEEIESLQQSLKILNGDDIA